MAAFFTLNHAIVSLCRKNSFRRKTGLIKLMVNIGRQNKIILFFYQLIKLEIQRQRRRQKTVHHAVFRPVPPPGFLTRKRIKACDIHIRHIHLTVFINKFTEIFRKTFPGISQPGRSRSSCTGSNQHGFCLFQQSSHTLSLLFIRNLLKNIVNLCHNSIPFLL